MNTKYTIMSRLCVKNHRNTYIILLQKIILRGVTLQGIEYNFVLEHSFSHLNEEIFCHTEHDDAEKLLDIFHPFSRFRQA